MALDPDALMLRAEANTGLSDWGADPLRLRAVSANAYAAGGLAPFTWEDGVVGHGLVEGPVRPTAMSRSWSRDPLRPRRRSRSTS